MLVQFLKEMEESNSSRSTIHTRRNPSDNQPIVRRTGGEREPLLRHQSAGETSTSVEVAQPVAGGTVLGIHNLSIVFPQFIVSADLFC